MTLKTLSRTIVFCVVVASLGCGGQQDKDKNKDLDRPRPAEKK